MDFRVGVEARGAELEDVAEALFLAVLADYTIIFVGQAEGR